MKKQVLSILGTVLFIVSVSASEAATVNINARHSTPVEIFLNPGMYSVTPIGISDGGDYDAWSPWSSSNCSDTNGCQRTYPTTNTGWVTDYYVESLDITHVNVNGSELTPVDTDPTPRFVNYWLSTDSETYFHVADDMVYPDALSALDNAQSSFFTLSDAGLVKFYATVTAFGDNRGGMSLSVDAVPIPGAIWLLGSGLAGIVGIRLRRKKK